MRPYNNNELLFLLVLLYLANLCQKKYTKFNNQCLETPYEMGIKLLTSAAEDEAKLAYFLRKESKKSENAIKKFKVIPCKKVTKNDLYQANCTLKNKINCIARIERNIYKKATIGKKLILNKDGCYKQGYLNNNCYKEKYLNCTNSCNQQFFPILILLLLLCNRRCLYNFTRY